MSMRMYVYTHIHMQMRLWCAKIHEEVFKHEIQHKVKNKKKK